MECSDLDRVSHVGMGVVQHSDTPNERANMLYVDGGTKISEGTTVAVYVVSGVRFLSCPCTEKQYFGVI
jgi:prepilin-type processing-associated H-X9-DG protein